MAKVPGVSSANRKLIQAASNRLNWRKIAITLIDRVRLGTAYR